MELDTDCGVDASLRLEGSRSGNMFCLVIGRISDANWLAHGPHMYCITACSYKLQADCGIDTFFCAVLIGTLESRQYIMQSSIHISNDKARWNGSTQRSILSL
jgi:hypothetical protein